MSARRIVFCGIFIVLNVLGALISIPIPPGVVKLTFQTLFVVLAGVILGPADGAVTQAVYILMGLFGLPVFSEGGGFFYVFKPSFGYLLAFPLGAWISGMCVKRSPVLRFDQMLKGGVLALLTIHILGVGYQIMIVTTVLSLGTAGIWAALLIAPVYLLKDCALVFLACLLRPRLSLLIRIKKKSDKNHRNIK